MDSNQKAKPGTESLTAAPKPGRGALRPIEFGRRDAHSTGGIALNPPALARSGFLFQMLVHANRR
jgi:hypothetical protein